MTSTIDSYQRKLKAILAEQKSDDKEITHLYENKLLTNSIIKLVIENSKFPNKKVGILDPLKVSQLLFADAVNVKKKIPNTEQIGLQIKSNQQVRSLFQVSR